MTQRENKPVIRLAPLRTPTRVKDLEVRAVGYVPAKQERINYRFDVHAVGLVVSGQGDYCVDQGPQHPVRPGTMLSVFPGPVFNYGPGPSGTWEEYYVIVTGQGIKRWIDAGWFPTEGMPHQLVDIAPLVERFRELMRILARAGPGDADRALVMTERLLLEMFYSRACEREARQAIAAIEAIVSHCHLHFADPIDFQALAESHDISYSHVRQQIRKVTGLPPHQYIIRLRCEQAQQLLNDTDLPVHQIADRVGIPDPYTFSRTFRRCVGMSPEQYRRRRM